MSPIIQFPYIYPYEEEISGSGKLFRPIIALRLVYGKRSIRVPSLLDTGADFPGFNARLALQLGIDLSSLPEKWVEGVGGKRRGWQSTLYLEFGPLLKPIQCKVWFIEELQLGRAIGFIGRDKALEPLIVAFNEADHEIYMALNLPSTS